MNEYESSNGRACFLTLTYAPEYLPKDNSLHVEDIQKFFKRLRKQLKGHKIKYYACGEYGDRNGRPHYHAIVFGLSVLDATVLLPKVWTTGYFKIMPVFYESCRYVTNYVMKKYNGELAKEVYGERKIPFRVSSLGLGKEYALRNREKIIENGGVRINGINKGFPKYYQTLFLKNDLSDVADYFTDNDIAFDEFDNVIDIVKNSGWTAEIKQAAIERNQKEKEAFEKWIGETDPESIVDFSVTTPFEQWKKSVDKLRDLTIKARCSLHEQKRRKKNAL